MAKVLVTGASGVLGRYVVQHARAAGHDVVPASRQSRPGWAALDVRKPHTFGNAVGDVEVVIHCAASPFRGAHAVEAGGIVNLAKVLPEARFIYPSIVGVDRIRFSYYRTKLATEQALEEAHVDHCIMRITQFHEFADRFATMPLPVVPKNFRSQTIAATEAAEHVVDLIDRRTQGMAAAVGGPEVHVLADLVRQRVHKRGRKVPILEVPMGGFSNDLAKGYQLCPDRAVGKMTWEEYNAFDVDSENPDAISTNSTARVD